jgi:DNA end-binding protein Ku
MAARAMASSTITFGLVAVPVQLYPATRESAGLSFHLLHAKDGVRLRQQLVCPKDGELVARNEAVRGFEHAKDEFVVVTDEELKALDQKASSGIEVAEFVKGGALAPLYVERSYYVGPGKGGERPFALFVRALEEEDLVAIAQYAARGKDYLVALRPFEGRLLMHQLYHQDEIRPVSEVPLPEAEAKAGELKLARELVGRLTAERFDPGRYEDEVRKRVRALIDPKVEGGEIRAAPGEGKAPAKVVDLMEALKASLAAGQAKPPASARQRETRPRAAKRAAPLKKAG